MRKRLGTLLMTGGAAALLIGLTTPSSFATTATTWSVSPGGAFMGKQSGPFKLTDTVTGNTLDCTVSSSKGWLKSGTGLSGNHIGALTSVSFSNCTGPQGLTFTMTNSHFPWVLSALTYDPAVTSGLTTGTLTGIHATISGTSCSATVDGTSATANNGAAEIHFHNSLDKLKIRANPTATNLHVYNVTGCLSLIKSGDAITFSSAWLPTPAQMITSP